MFKNNDVIGIGAFLNDKLVGYLFGIITISTRIGRGIVVPYEGLAIRKDHNLELIRKLYAEVSPLWLEQGCFQHSIFVPLANKTYYESLINLSFAVEQVHGILNIDEYVPFNNIMDLNIRLANEKDRDSLINMSSIIAQHQNNAPVFIPTPFEYLKSLQAGFGNLIDSDDIVLLAESNSKIVGYQIYETIDSSLMVPDQSIKLDIAATHPMHTGKGIGKSIMNYACEYLWNKGIKYIITDWRISNLDESLFWPKCGFIPTVYRMIRFIDSNWAWANFNNPSLKQFCIK